METLPRTMAAAVLGLLAVTAGPARAQVSESAPYYALPSWDQQLSPSTRFILLTNWNSQAVLDRETGLVWEQTPVLANVGGWQAAVSNCGDAPVGGRFGWRLPSREELLSLAVPDGNSTPALPNSPFSINVIGVLFWTSTSIPTVNGAAYQVKLGGLGLPGSIEIHSVNDLAPHWCGRGGQGTHGPL